MADANDKYRQSLQAFLKAHGLTRNGLAVRTKVGESVIRKFLKGESASFTDATWEKLAKGVGVDAEVLRNFPVQDVGPHSSKVDPIIIPETMNGNLSSDTPVFAPWGDDMDKKWLGRKPAERKPAPGSLQLVEGVFGVLVTDSSMEDKMEPEDIAWVHPSRPPKIGKYCVFLGPEGERGPAVVIRKLIGMTDAKWRVLRLKPRYEYDLARSEWPRACQIKHIESP